MVIKARTYFLVFDICDYFHSEMEESSFKHLFFFLTNEIDENTIKILLKHKYNDKIFFSYYFF